MTTKHRQSIKCQWSKPMAFKPTIKQTIDDERIAREAAQLVKDRAVSESQQTEIRHTA